MTPPGFEIRSGFRLLAMASFVPVAVAFAGRAAAQDDYGPEVQEWNGLSELTSIADAEAVRLDVVDYLDIGELTPRDAVLIIYPTEDLPVGELARFMREGGRIALADDFGTGDELLSVYRIDRREADVSEALHLRGNRDLPIARPASRHVLTEGISSLVANHPTTLAHHKLEPLFAFHDASEALVLAGAVDEGRLVAVGDASLFINNMLEFRDNRQFCRNLLRYLEGGRGGRVVLVVGDAEIAGRYGEPGADQPLHDVAQWLDDLAHADAPPLALLLGAIVLSAILVVVAATSLPRRSPYDGASMFARPPASGGFVGRVGFFRRGTANLLTPTLTYKFEFEGELVRLLDLSGRALLRDVLSAMRSRGLDESELAEVRSLLLTLDDLRDRQDKPPGPPQVSAARFRELVALGERILGRLEGRGTTP